MLLTLNKSETISQVNDRRCPLVAGYSSDHDFARKLGTRHQSPACDWSATMRGNPSTHARTMRQRSESGLSIQDTRCESHTCRGVGHLWQRATATPPGTNRDANRLDILNRQPLCNHGNCEVWTPDKSITFNFSKHRQLNVILITSWNWIYIQYRFKNLTMTSNCRCWCNVF